MYTIKMLKSGTCYGEFITLDAAEDHLLLKGYKRIECCEFANKTDENLLDAAFITDFQLVGLPLFSTTKTVQLYNLCKIEKIPLYPAEQLPKSMGVLPSAS